MTSPQTDIKTQLTDLSSEAMEAFCNDISGMFGVDMTSDLSSGVQETARGLEKTFKNPAAVLTINARGVLNGEFYIVFDKEGLFTLAGTIVMLPEQDILTSRKNGSQTDAEALHDAVVETGNLLVGSWDRIFREEREGHIHFLQSSTFIGNPWEASHKRFPLEPEETVLFFPCRISVGSFPAFHCGVIFPEAVYEKKAVEEPASAALTGSEAVETPDAKEPEAASPEACDAPAEADLPESEGGVVSQTIRNMMESLPLLPAEHAQALLGVSAKDIMKKDVLWGLPDDSVQDAMEKMQAAETAYLLVGQSDFPEGIVTWIDIAEAVSIYLRPVFSKWRRPADDATLQIKLKVIMTRPVRTIKPQTPLSVIVEDMSKCRLRCLPVVNDSGKVEGVVSPFDIFSVLMKLSPDLSVSDTTA
jgi:CBS domain-containing protein